MRSTKHLTAGELREVLGTPETPLSAEKLHQWVSRGIISPSVNPGGSGRARLFRIVPDALAVAAVLGLRASGFTMGTCAAVADVLQQHDEASLRSDLDAGRSYMLLLDGSDEAALPRLVTEKAARESIAEFESPVGLRLQPAALDVGTLYANLLKAIAEAREQAEAELVG